MRDLSGLNSILRFRRSLERAAQLSLKRVVAEINLNFQERERIAGLRIGLRRSLRDRLRAGIGAEEFAMYSETTLDGVERQLNENLRVLETRRAKSEAHYVQCRQDRKVIENMVSRRLAEARIASARREQTQIDESTLQRMGIGAAASSVSKSE